MKLQGPMACWQVAINHPKEKPLVGFSKVQFFSLFLMGIIDWPITKK
jgi:hypothetical protein